MWLDNDDMHEVRREYTYSSRRTPTEVLGRCQAYSEDDAILQFSARKDLLPADFHRIYRVQLSESTERPDGYLPR